LKIDGPVLFARVLRTRYTNMLDDTVLPWTGAGSGFAEFPDMDGAAPTDDLMSASTNIGRLPQIPNRRL
jgi:hypothetical protein